MHNSHPLFQLKTTVNTILPVLLLRPIALAFAALALLSSPSLGYAAEITDVADAADEFLWMGKKVEKPIDVYLKTNFDGEFSWGKITREPINQEGQTNSSCNETKTRDCMPVDELKWGRSNNTIHIGMELGIYHDLSLTFDLPIILGNTIEFNYADNVNASNSTVDPTDPQKRLFINNYAATRKGLGHLALGFRWGLLNDERDVSKPNWVVFFNWGMPYTGDVYDPGKKAATKNSPGPAGDGIHWLTVGTSFSKRVAAFGLINIDPNHHRRGYLEPYMHFSGKIPIPQDGGSKKAPAPFYEGSFAALPSYIGEMKAGFEYVPYEDFRRHQKFAIDVALRTRFFSEGRNYSELSDALGELTYTEQYIEVGGQLGVVFQASDIVKLRFGLRSGYVTEHFLTSENVGSDGDQPGDPGFGQVEPDNPNDKLNPYFCGNATDGDDKCSIAGVSPYDQVGFRFKSERQFFFHVFTGMQLSF